MGADLLSFDHFDKQDDLRHRLTGILQNDVDPIGEAVARERLRQTIEREGVLVL